MQLHKKYYAVRLCIAVFMVVALLVAGGAPAAYAQDDVEEANKALVSRLTEEVYDQRNLDAVAEFYAPGYIAHTSQGTQTFDTIEAIQESIAADFEGLPDSAVTVDDLVAEGDRVVVRYTMAINDGEIVVGGISIVRIDDGKVVEEWEVFDELGLMTQLGMLPAPEDVEEANIAVVTRYFEELINEENLDVIDDIFAPGYIEQFVAEEATYDDLDDLKKSWTGLFTELGPIQIEIDDMFADGDRVVTRFTASMGDGAATVTGMRISLLEDGKMVAGWEQMDELGMMTQLGMLPAPEEEMAEPVSIAAGFNGPQGVLVDDDGNVWVIDAGLGGDEDVEWVAPGVGLQPAKIGDTARVVRIDADGEQTDVAMLPSVAVGEDFIGGARLALLDGELYATVGQWLGELGEDRLPLQAAVVNIHEDGTVEEVGTTWDLEVAENPDGYMEDSHPYGLATGPDGRLWVADAGANTLVAVDPGTGEVTLEAVFDGIPGPMPNPARGDAMEMDPVPTGIAFDDDGTAYVSLLPGFPFIPGSTKVVTVDADGNVADYATGLTMLTDLRRGPDGNLYAVQFAVFTDQGPTPMSGAIVRVLEGDGSEIVVDGLSFPTSLDFNDAGDAYITINGVGSPGSGEVVMVSGLTHMPGIPVAEAMEKAGE